MAKKKKEEEKPHVPYSEYKLSGSVNTRHLKRKMLGGMEKSLGIVTTGAKTAGIHKSTHYEWMKSDPEYARAYNDLEDVALDFGESMLHQNMEKGKEASTIFFLKTKGKKRGYIERNELEIDTGDGNITINIE